jgi:hypothetical protein
MKFLGLHVLCSGTGVPPSKLPEAHLVYKSWRYGGIGSQFVTAISLALLETGAEAQAQEVLRREGLIVLPLLLLW